MSQEQKNDIKEEKQENNLDNSAPKEPEKSTTDASAATAVAGAGTAAAAATVAVEDGKTNLLKRGMRKYGKGKKRRRKKIILPDRMPVYNAKKARIYRVAVDGRRSSIAFPTPENKRYYLDCVMKMMRYFPIEIMAFAITNQRAYFVLASYDQTPVSYKRFIANVNTLYSEYYNGLYSGSGYVFGTDTRDKRLTDAAQVAESIAVIHSQPSATNLCEGFDYPFSSYRPNKMVTMEAFVLMAGGEEKAARLLDDAHAGGPRLLPADFFNLPREDKFTVVIENVLVDYGYYQIERVPNDVMHRIIAEVNERGNFPFRVIVRRIGLRKAFKYEMLIKVIVDLALNKKQIFDESIANLQIDFVSGAEKRELIQDVFFMISNRTGYAYDYIMNVLGFAYPNYNFLVDMILYVADMKGISVEAALKRLGIRERIGYVLTLVRQAQGAGYIQNVE